MRNLDLQVNIRELEALAAELGANLSGRAINMVAGRGVQEYTRRHLLEINRTRPNKLGGKRTEYWRKAAHSLTLSSEGDAAVVTITAPGVGLHIDGGTVRRRPGGPALSVPSHADAHGKRPREMYDLSPVFWRKGGKLRGGLVRNAQTRLVQGRKDGKLRKGRSLGGELMFVFKDEVEVPRMPDVMPKVADLQKEAVRAIASIALGQKLRGRNG